MSGGALTQTLASKASGLGSPNKRPVPNRRPYPHLDDLVTSAKPARTKDSRFSELISDVQTNLSQANWNLDLGRLDLAFVDFIRASHILIELVPRHQDWPGIRALEEPARYGRVLELQRRVNAQTAQFEQIRDQIKHDNTRNGTQRRTDSGRNGVVKPTTSSEIDPISSSPTSKLHSISSTPTRTHPGQTSNGSPQSPPIANFHETALHSPKRRPAVRSKPQHLVSRPLVTTAVSEDLNNRFARLRPQSPDTGAQHTVGGGTSSSRLSNGVKQQLDTGNTIEHVLQLDQHEDEAAFNARFPPVEDPDLVPRERPMGPRDPPPRPAQPAVPPKIPLPDHSSNLPRAPSPAYNPITRTSSGYFASSANRSSKLSVLPVGPEISATALYQCSKPGPDRLDVLLIDVRSRGEFDAGHIMLKTVMCVEPLAISSQMSAEDLENRLVVSPEGEQALFGRRQTFDAVVLYDFDGRARNVVEDLARILWDFSYEKPLIRQPFILQGGLKAWVNLLGLQAMTIPKKDASNINPIALRDARPISRLPSASLIQRRKTLEREPLKARESQRWLDRLRADDDVKYRSPGSDGAGAEPRAEEGGHPATEQGESGFNQSYDDYVRRTIRSQPPSIQEDEVAQQHLAYPPVPRPTYNSSQPIVPSRPIPVDRPEHSLIPSRPPPAAPRQSYGGVSEKAPPMPSGHPGQTFEKRPPPPSLSYSISPLEDGSIGKTGLQNLGNTCYMNSVLQCLSATSPLSHYFLKGSHVRDVVKENKLGSRGILPLVYANLLSFLWKGNYKFIVPTTLREFCGRLNEDFRNNRQQDANDFFVFFVDLLHEDLNQNYNKVRLKELTVAEERTRETLPVQKASQIEWDRWTHSNFSVVARQFGGQHASRLRCLSCGFTSTSFETFYSIPLEIPLKGKSNIYQCLENYTKEEKLDKDNNWKCPQCDRVQGTSKKITITRAPPVLVIQFKRFKTSKHGWMDKIKTKVDFPSDSLDITPFAAPALPPDPRDPGRTTEPEATPPYKYDLYGIVNHFGTLDGGHYKAVIRSGSKSSWVEFDDSRVSKFDPSKIVSDAAYMLFCVRNLK